jgi:hypothetical protein
LSAKEKALKPPWKVSSAPVNHPNRGEVQIMQQMLPQNYRVSQAGYSKGEMTWQLPDATTLQAMWTEHMLRSGCQHYTAPDEPRVLLGQRAIADAQRAADGENLAYLVCHRGM